MRSQPITDFTSSLNHSDIRGVVENAGPNPLEVRHRSFRCKESEALDHQEKSLTVMDDPEPEESACFQECTLNWPLFSRHVADLDEIEIRAAVGTQASTNFRYNHN
jgi:hypothetical protein